MNPHDSRRVPPPDLSNTPTQLPQSARLKPLTRVSGNRVAATTPPTVPLPQAPGSMTAQPVSTVDGSTPNRVGRYELLDLLGQGGMGAVYRALDRRADRHVALKIMLAPRPSPESLTRFLNEARLTSQLEHPNIVPVHDVDPETHATPYFVMKLVAGKSLKALLTESRDAVAARRPDPFPLSRRLDVFIKVCDAVAFANDRGVLHRDLKPDNVMVGQFGEVQVMDWGLAKQVGRDKVLGHPAPLGRLPHSTSAPASPDRLDLTAEGSVLGTVAFMPPEQARGDLEQMSAASDVFALGALLYAMLTYSAPYRGDTAMRVLWQAMEADVEPLHRRLRHDLGRHAPPIPRELEAICLKAMAKQPRHRYPRADTLKADVLAYLALEPVLAYRASLMERVLKWTRRHPQLSLAAMFLLVIGVGLSVAVAQLADAETRAERERRIRAEAERRADRERLQGLAAAGQIGDLKRALGIDLTLKRDAALAEFAKLVDKEGQRFDDTFWSRLPPETTIRLSEAMRSFEHAANEFGIAELTANDCFYLGVFAAAHRDWKRAIHYYTMTLEREPTDRIAAVNRGVARRELGDLDGAIADYSLALNLDPKLSPAYANRAQAKAAKGDTQGALNDANQAIALNPALPAPYVCRGNLKQSAGDWDGAIHDFSTAIQLEPRLAEPYFNRGNARKAKSDFTGAIADFTSALRLNPRWASAYYNRGNMFKAINELDAAIRDYTEAVFFDPTMDEAYYNRGNTYQLKRDWGNAVADYDAALMIKPDKWEAWTNRGSALALLNRRDEARQSFAKGFEYCPAAKRSHVETARKRALGE